MPRHACPCCRYPTLDEPPPGTYEICPVCWWEDDPVQFRDPSFRGGANAESLSEARASFELLGVSDPKMRDHVREPTDEERAHRTPDPRN